VKEYVFVEVVIAPLVFLVIISVHALVEFYCYKYVVAVPVKVVAVSVQVIVLY